MADGNHYGGFKYRNRRNTSNRGRNSILGTVITAIAGTVVKDLTSDNSKIKKLFNKVIHPKQIGIKNENRKVIDAEYSVEDNDNIGKLNENKKIDLNGENQ